MLSTYVTFLKYAQSAGKAEKRVAADPAVAREAKYYRENIGNVKTVDEFLNNYRLFSYAMKANGLEDMSYAKGFMRKVLLSDLTDKTSFANKLTDKRYAQFAETFNFNSDGSLTDSTAVQNLDQLSDTTTRYAALYPTADRQTYNAYYWVKMDHVTSVEGIVFNEKLRTVVLSAYGLDPANVSEDTLRKTLTSDLSDPNSFANTIGDARFVALAGAFNFNTDGSVKDGYNAQSGSQMLRTDKLYLQPAESTYFTLKLGDVHTVDDLLNDDRMRSYVITALGLDSNTTKATLRSALTSDLNDPSSYANTIGDARFVALASAFNFDTAGAVKSGYAAQSTEQNTNFTDLYYLKTHSAIGTEVDYYEEQIGNVHSVDELLEAKHLTSFVLTAYGLDPQYTSAAAIRAALTSDLSDPTSFANQTGYGAFKTLAQAFNFASDGSVKAGYDIQSADQKAATTEAYLSNAVATENANASNVSSDTTAYKSAIGKAKSLSDLLSNTDTTDYILKAYGLENDDISMTTLRLVLESDLSDPKSFVNQTGDDKLKALAADFNFTANGMISTPRAVQSSKNIETIVAAYATVLGDGASAKATAETETTYYKNAIKNVGSLDELMSDTRLTNYIITAFKLDPKTTTNTLRAVLTSDLSNVQSAASKLGENYREVALAFNFTTTGTIAREAGQSPQSAKNVQATYDSYIAQFMETEAGNENEGARLALYFRRKASSINTAYDILADKALAVVVRTALGISANAASADLDVQARQITNKLKLSDLKDTSYLDKFLAQFAALYDLQNNSATSSSGAASLISQALSSNSALGGATIIGFNENLLHSAMNARKL